MNHVVHIESETMYNNASYPHTHPPTFISLAGGLDYLLYTVLKGPTGQSSPGKATESRGVGMRVEAWIEISIRGGVRNFFFFDFPSLIPIMGENTIRT